MPTNNLAVYHAMTRNCDLCGHGIVMHPIVNQPRDSTRCVADYCQCLQKQGRELPYDNDTEPELT